MKRFPRGKLREDDEGKLSMAVLVQNNTVILSFGKPVRWLGLGAHEARGLAELLLKHAASLEA